MCWSSETVMLQFRLTDGLTRSVVFFMTRSERFSLGETHLLPLLAWRSSGSAWLRSTSVSRPLYSILCYEQLVHYIRIISFTFAFITSECSGNLLTSTLSVDHLRAGTTRVFTDMPVRHGVPSQASKGHIAAQDFSDNHSAC